MKTPPRITIRLAGPSLLYAPLYLARTIARYDQQDRAFKIFSRVDFDYAPPPKSSDDIDPLISPMLKPASNFLESKNYLLAIGDPLRITSAVNHKDIPAPFVAGSLINKICLWMIDRLSEPDIPLHNSYSKIIVHPPGMTSHTAMCYYLANECQLTQPDPYLVFRQPGIEEIWYRAFRWSMAHERTVSSALNATARKLRFRNRRLSTEAPSTAKHAAFITANPLLGTLCEARYGRWDSANTRSILPFYSIPSDKPALEPLRGAAMTAFITSRDRWDDRRSHSEIEDVLFAVANALNLMRTDPELASNYLRDYQDERLDLFGYRAKEMQHCLSRLVEKEVYNQRADMRLLDTQLVSTIKLRKGVTKQGDQSKLATLEDNATSFFALVRADQDLHEQSKEASGRELLSDSDAAKILCQILPEISEADRIGQRWQFIMSFVAAALLVLISRVAPSATAGNPFSGVKLLSTLGLLLIAMGSVKHLWEVRRWLKEEGKGFHRRIYFFRGLVDIFVVGGATWHTVKTIGALFVGESHEPSIGAARVDIIALVAAIIVVGSGINIWSRYQLNNGGFGRAHGTLRALALKCSNFVWVSGWMALTYVLVLPWRALTSLNPRVSRTISEISQESPPQSRP